MKFPEYFLDQLRSQLPPSQVIRRSVRLTGKSGGEYVGLCPFHNEKTPSFTVSDNKGFYHCFGCSAHGDIIKFVMETSGLTFADTVKELASEAGLALPVLTKEQEQRQQKISDIYEIMELATVFFQQQLTENIGREAREYLVKREIKPEQIKKFRLGFAPDGSALQNHLKAKGISDESLMEAGLLGKGEGGEIYARFRARIIFPIADERGKVIAFGGRSLGDQMPKYLNSPETDIFKKGYNLYNLNNAREIARKRNEIIVVEGYMDVIAMDAAGIANTVAPLGTALTEQQLLKLWNYAPEPVIFLDGDDAGKRAMSKTTENCLPYLKPGNSLSFVILPEQDPDEAIKSHGIEYIRREIANPMLLSEALWDIELRRGMNPKTPEQIAALESRLSRLASLIKDATVRNYYARFFKEKLFEYSRKKSSKKMGKQANQEVVKRTRFVSTLGHMEGGEFRPIELLLLKYVLDCPEILEDPVIAEELERLEFRFSKLDKVRVAILEHNPFNSHGQAENLYESLEKQGINLQMFYGKGSGVGISLKPGSVIEEAKAGWQVALARHNLLQLRELIGKENDPERQHELQQQVAVLEDVFTSRRAGFETILKIDE